MKFKKGVSADGLRPEILSALEIADELHQIFHGTEAEITSTTEGEHREGSKHYMGLAADVRDWYVDPRLYSAVLQFCLGKKHYRVIAEPTVKKPNGEILRGSHIHIQFNPEEN